MFVLPDVASSGIAAVGLLPVIFFYPRCSLLIHCNIAYHIVLQILLCVFFWHKMYIYYMYEYIYIYMLVCENYIFIDIFDISVNFLHISWWVFSHKCIVYKVFQ